MKVEDDELRRRLNLLELSNDFVLKESGNDGAVDVLSPEKIPDEDGVYWVSGMTVAASNREIVSVFCVDTNAGGSLLSIFWKVGSAWFYHDSEAALQALGVSRNEIFPFDWRYHVPLENDIFHS